MPPISKEFKTILFKCYDLKEITDENVDSLLQFINNPDNKDQVELVIGDNQTGPPVIFLIAGLRYGSNKNNRLKYLPKCIDDSKVDAIFSSWISESNNSWISESRKSFILKDKIKDQMVNLVFIQDCVSFGTYIEQCNSRFGNGWLRKDATTTNDKAGIRFQKLSKLHKSKKLIPLEASLVKLQISLLRGENPLFNSDEILSQAWGVSDRQIRYQRTCIRDLFEDDKKMKNSIHFRSPFKSPRMRPTKKTNNQSTPVTMSTAPSTQFQSMVSSAKVLFEEQDSVDVENINIEIIGGAYNDDDQISPLSVDVMSPTSIKEATTLRGEATTLSADATTVVGTEATTTKARYFFPKRSNDPFLRPRPNKDPFRVPSVQVRTTSDDVSQEDGALSPTEEAELRWTAEKAKELQKNYSNHLNVLVIPTSKSKGLDGYTRCAQKSNWIDDMLLKSISSEESAEDAATYLLLNIAKKYPKTFEMVGQQLGYPCFRNKPMDAALAASMWSEANIPIRGQRIIRRYFRGHFGIPLTVPEIEIQKTFASAVVEPSLESATIGDGNQIICYWYRPIDAVVIHLIETEWKEIKFKTIEIIFGGDHGQKVFGASIKIILRDTDWNVVKSRVEKVGHIECTKDTYEILEATIAGKLNHSLKKMKGKILHITKENEECMATFDDPDDNAAVPTLIQEADTTTIDNGTPGPKESYHDVKVYGVGDLAFVSMILGKVNMDGHWCYLCDLSPNEWSQLHHTEGRPWTLTRMKDTISKISNDELKDIPKNRRGCVTKSLMDVFEPFDFIPPCLHMMMGAFNDALKGLLKYIDIRHELVSVVESIKRDAYWKAESMLANATDSLQKYEEEHQQQVQTKSDQIKQLEEKRKQVVVSGGKRTYVYSNDEKMAFKMQESFLKLKIQELEGTKKEKIASVSQLKLIRDQAKIELIKERKERKATDSVIRQKIESILAKHGVDRGACHGGELTGVACRILENNIIPIMADIKEVLLSIETTTVPPEEVQDQLESYEIHFLLLSKVFSLARTEKKIFKDPRQKAEILDDLTKTITLLNRSTFRLGLSMRTVKRHICSDHLVQFVDVHNGIADYLEDWLEQTHQTYKALNSKAKIRDTKKKAVYEIKQQTIRQNDRVMEAGRGMYEITRRNFKKEQSNITKSEQDQILRYQRRDEAVERARHLFQNKPSLPTGSALAMEEVGHNS